MNDELDATGQNPPRFRAPGPSTATAPGVRGWSACSYSIVQGFRPILLDVRVPVGLGDVPAVLWVHGGGWRDGDRRYLPETLVPDAVVESLLAKGIAYVTADYRLSAEAIFPAQLHDVKAAIRYLRAFAGEFGIYPNRIGAWGESAGGLSSRCWRRPRPTIL